MEVIEIKKEKKEVNQKTVRFSDAAWYKPGISVVIGGVGSIGSHVAYYLGRQECDMILYDMDVVDEVNLAGQLFRMSDIGKKKTDITKEMIYQLSGNKNVEVFGEFTADSMIDNYVFSCFDNMKARKLFFEAWCAIDSTDKVFIDGRTNAEQAQIFIVTPDRIDRYKEELFDDSVVPDIACTYKSTTFCAGMVAAFMVSGFNNLMASKASGFDIADYPFKTEYNLQLFKVETNE